VSALVISITLLAAGAGAGRSEATPATSWAYYGATADPTEALVHRSLSLPGVPSRGGPITTSTGETVNVFVSDSLPTVTPEQWAEFIAHLDHGSEISKVTVQIATLDEVQQICGAQALGCYGDNQLISMGETFTDGTTPEEVVRHEYGHHIAFNRANPPWAAIDWGPKYWASVVGVCKRVKHDGAYPGDEGVHYDQNPGEAWAETYRVLEERKAGIFDSKWQIVSRNFFPNEASLAAAERDVLHPWTAGTSATYRTNFTQRGKKVWLVPVQTLLDGNLNLKVTLPRAGLYDLAVLSPNRRTVMRHAVSRGGTTRIVGGICGIRSLYVRVSDRSGSGRVSVTVSTP
jgi:hypothetical protein